MVERNPLWAAFGPVMWPNYCFDLSRSPLSTSITPFISQVLRPNKLCLGTAFCQFRASSSVFASPPACPCRMQCGRIGLPRRGMVIQGANHGDLSPATWNWKCSVLGFGYKTTGIFAGAMPYRRDVQLIPEYRNSKLKGGTFVSRG